MSKSTKLKLVQSYNKLLEEKHQLEREKAWLIKQIENFTYDGMRVAPPGPLGITWEEAATYHCLPEDKQKDFKTEFSKELEINLGELLEEDENGEE